MTRMKRHYVIGTAGHIDHGKTSMVKQLTGKNTDWLQEEIARGMTLVGPHRDGLRFKVNEADMSKYGSRGQQQTIAISLKLAEAKHMHAEVGDYPILLLDDVFSELDLYRRQHLLDSIAPFQQVLISAVDVDCFEPSHLARATRLRVRQGNVEPV